MLLQIGLSIAKKTTSSTSGTPSLTVALPLGDAGASKDGGRFDSSRLDIQPMSDNPVENKKREDSIRAVFDWSLRVIEKHAPELRRELDREAFQILVPIDVKRFAASNFNQNPPPGTNAMTLTRSNGRTPPLAEETVMLFQSRDFLDSTKSVEERDVRALATIVHEIFHLQQPMNARRGQPMTVQKEQEAEIDAYSRELKLLEKIRDSWKTEYPKYAEILGTVIADQEKMLASWKARRQVK